MLLNQRNRLLSPFQSEAKGDFRPLKEQCSISKFLVEPLCSGFELTIQNGVPVMGYIIQSG
jgi:hypothetical protein